MTGGGPGGGVAVVVSLWRVAHADLCTPMGYRGQDVAQITVQLVA